MNDSIVASQTFAKRAYIARCTDVVVTEVMCSPQPDVAIHQARPSRFAGAELTGDKNEF
jgi:hypothetical protein